MSKKLSKLEITKQFNEHLCKLCILNKNTKPRFMMAQNNLNQKYYYPQIETYHYRIIQPLIKNKEHPNHIAVKQIDTYHTQKQLLQTYLHFQMIVSKIKGVIIKRVQNDFYSWIDFKQLNRITTKHYLLLKKYHQKCRGKYNSNRNTGMDQVLNYNQGEYINRNVLKGLNNSRFTAKTGNNQTNTSHANLRILTSNIDQMIKQISNLSNIRHKRAKSKKKIDKKSKKSLDLPIFPGISEINKEEKVKQKEKNHHENHQQTYGLTHTKTKVHKNKLHKLSLRSADRLHLISPLSLPQSPKPQLLHPTYKYIKSIHTSHHSTNNETYLRSHPSSPGLHGSLTLGLSQSLTKKSVSARKKRPG